MNNEIRKRKIILYIVIFLILTVIVFLCGSVLIKNTNVNLKEKNKQELPNEDISNVINAFDENKIRIVKVGKSKFFEADIYDVYYGDKKILSSSDNEIVGISDVRLFASGIIFNVEYNDNAGGKGFVILDANTEVVSYSDGKYYKVRNLSGQIYRGEYKVVQNKIFLYSDNLGQDFSVACTKKDKPVEYIDVITYSNGEYSKVKLYDSITGNEFATENYVNCSKYK